jgi:hypothetical protein
MREPTMPLRKTRFSRPAVAGSPPAKVAIDAGRPVPSRIVALLAAPRMRTFLPFSEKNSW